MQIVNNTNLQLNSILTSISRICKRLHQKHKAGAESYKKLHQSCKYDVIKIDL